MATLQKFKLLASQCAVAASPTRSPSASPVFHLRRRKTLRMLLTRPDRRGSDPPEISGRENDDVPPRRARRKLKDLFVSSPPLEARVSEKRNEASPERRLLPVTGGVSAGFAARRRGFGSLRPAITGGFRYRFLRRAWRPVLVSIPE